ncbi:hypothetical protein, partial [Ruegeria lacuscaerulensis]|uniref:hypothetical protein n=1 Tax=Ruegeria lacuscaerulensis TaxID=55218 RepID=UPI001BE3FDED
QTHNGTSRPAGASTPSKPEQVLNWSPLPTRNALTARTQMVKTLQKIHALLVSTGFHSYDIYV